MNVVFKSFLILLLAVAFGWSRDFMGLPVEDEVSDSDMSMPGFVVGGGLSLAYYLRGFDGTVDVDAEYRIHRLHSLGLHGGISIAGEFVETGLDWRWYFKGALIQTGHDDFLHFSPAVEFGYGRDILFFKKTELLGRIEVQASYLLGEPVTKMNDRLLVDESGRLIVNIRFSLLFF